MFYCVFIDRYLPFHLSVAVRFCPIVALSPLFILNIAIKLAIKLAITGILNELLKPRIRLVERRELDVEGHSLLVQGLSGGAVPQHSLRMRDSQSLRILHLSSELDDVQQQV